eukprot:PLAT8787.1.p1 GENE.PLAT8787.1~~PLAT8787.1.p1  ORF type:complete len:185 (-),score=84.11 PLAT8787.1:234-788(-)
MASIATRGLPPKQFKQLEEVFALYDRFETGKVSLTDLPQMLRYLQYNPTEAELLDLLTDVDEDKEGTLDFHSFVTVVKDRMGAPDPAEAIIQSFRVFDKDGNGFVSGDLLRQVMTSMGEKLSDEEMEEMMRQADVDGDGHINYEDFVHAMLRPPAEEVGDDEGEEADIARVAASGMGGRSSIGF